MVAEKNRPTREDLEAMRKEYVAEASFGRGDGGLPFNLDDDLKQARLMTRLGLPPEQWAEARGVPVEYARALLRHIG
jgi:hypothetical protein